jgi:hypothetical protein
MGELMLPYKVGRAACSGEVGYFDDSCAGSVTIPSLAFKYAKVYEL